MRPTLILVALLAALAVAAAQESGGFELPVQLIGFPVIIVAVRIANFLKKMSYALNPNTYRSRSRRGIDVNPDTIDVDEVEKRLVKEMGQGVCIYHRVCSAYAERAPAGPNDIDWNDIFSKFSSYPRDMGENYILSVFLGDIVGSAALCRGLAKRGRDCEARRGLYPVPQPPQLPKSLPHSLPQLPQSLPQMYHGLPHVLS
ncbi:Hypothetical protein NTJ_06642 [Nesidiocoris tenuis]|uniref:Uncharacterized protein n=1 Tax=Nesidiocoris tenuis TaxID=355587 RepID=A0ABN7APD4_9HEMI|nr:Hypothetical protein NTJ_06642 [Nesidiocoris tenuis]